MIITKLYGGMGNQMFIYAFSRMLQERYKEPILLNTFELEHNQTGYTKRTYALECFALNNNCRILNNYEKNIYETILKCKRLRIQDAPISQEVFAKLAKTGLYTSDKLFYYYNFSSTERNLKFVDGYFMSWKYFENIKIKLIKDFRIKIPPSKENFILLKEIKKQNSVCVHIRRGDYLSSQFKKTNDVCTESYYLNAMKYIEKKVDNPVFYIFSTSNEDIEWIKKHYSFENFHTKYVELENPDYEELRLMRNCKHFIIANSTFSWWAQYLCTNKEKIVIAPDTWLNVSKCDQRWVNDIYMPNWKLISAN